MNQFDPDYRGCIIDLGRIVAREVARQNDEREWQLRQMLGEWVSEAEPALMINHNGQLIGLGPEGIAVGEPGFLVVQNRWCWPPVPRFDMAIRRDGNAVRTDCL